MTRRKGPGDKEWAPCLHKPKDKAVVGPWLLAILNDNDSYRRWAENELFVERDVPVVKYKVGDEIKTVAAHVDVSLNPKLTETLLWMIADLSVPTGQPPKFAGGSSDTALTLQFVSDQWVGVSAAATLYGKEESTWVEADDFTLALAKTLEVWRNRIKEGEPK